ncbi:hypothetical protein BZG36_02771 [Bifiguratus adelaidae]|uniref:NADPH--hemoprotein reductase n=1 Tax=Bifiguratus adelaidae TaxID=1938954 RepID=A0A261Y262_9FUNG|nr:hypothetical protein BZG36_02771 [Bifiguratus adelaidae]
MVVPIPLNEADQVSFRLAPGPKGRPFIGNLYDVFPDTNNNYLRLFAEYGPVMNLSILGNESLNTNDPEVAEIWAKESDYYTKKVVQPLSEVKPIGGNGLFTSDTDDMDWKLAHKLLMPAFSPRAVKAYQKEMGEITAQAIKVFDEYAPDEKFEILNWTTNITFETIGRVGFGYDFHLLDQGKNVKPHPFIEAMSYTLKQVITRNLQAQFMKRLPLEQNRRFDQSLALMHGIIEQVIAERKAAGPRGAGQERDLLDYMLTAQSEEGDKLSDELIRDQVNTFLIAGHDTSANTLSFVLYELSRHPEIKAKVLQEIANAGINHTDYPTSEQISQLKYLHMVIKETLRLYSPLRLLTKYCKKDNVLPGGFVVKAGTTVQINSGAMHRNPKVYPNPHAFDPERFSPEEEQKRSSYAWLPFSTGPRACIGMALALQEIKTVLAMCLHKFDFIYHETEPIAIDPSSPTQKPLHLFMTVQKRTNFPEPNSDLTLVNIRPTSPAPLRSPAPQVPVLAEGVKLGSLPLPKLTVLFGTETGTSQDYATQLASQARAYGFPEVTVMDIDKWPVLQAGKYSATSEGAPNEMVVFVTATYNGLPPENAEKFSAFISDESKDSGLPFKRLSFAVFGVGNSNWRTFGAFPNKIDTRMAELGADRLFAIGQGDADKDIDHDFAEWNTRFWGYVLQLFGATVMPQESTGSNAPVSITDGVVVEYLPMSESEQWERANQRKKQDCVVKLTVNKELQDIAKSGRSTRHIELDILSLPKADKDRYQAGDHFEIWPENDAFTVESVALGFGLVLDAVFEVKDANNGSLSSRSLAKNIKGPCRVRDALTLYADLRSPPSRYMLSCFADQLAGSHPDIEAQFRELVQTGPEGKAKYEAFIEKNRTPLDLQRNFPMVKEMALKDFLCAVTVMAPRRYSIACSPLKHPESVHLAVGVVEDHVNNRTYPGLCSGFLSHSKPDTLLRANVKSAKETFALPKDDTAPVIMISAGTGLAPFRGFLEERQARSVQSDTYVFFGCRHPDQDFIYRSELEDYVKDGTITKVFTCFSRNSESGDPKRYVQHHILANSTLFWKLIKEEGAHVYICGAGNMARDVRRVFELICQSVGDMKNDNEACAYVERLIETGKWCEDVWG